MPRKNWFTTIAIKRGYFYLLYFGQVNIKLCPGIHLACGGNITMMVFYNFLYNGQTNSGTGIFVTGVQTLEKTKDDLLIILGDTDAVVANRKLEPTSLALARNVNRGSAVGAPVLEGITDQVLKNLVQVGFVHWDAW